MDFITAVGMVDLDAAVEYINVLRIALLFSIALLMILGVYIFKLGIDENKRHLVVRKEMIALEVEDLRSLLDEVNEMKVGNKKKFISLIENRIESLL